ncbi:hypothetical protein [Devosia sp.]|uniref:COG4315 family predicted lipoprotein n=1 Tax=Devosia sp. TaxID=1871048 RepID=UPI003A8F23B3
MKLAILAGAAALTVLSTAAFAEDYVGGAIKTMEINGVEVLTGANGMTLYTFDKDEPGVSNCNAQCAANWPPAIADAGATPEGDFTLVDRADGAQVWAYKGWPLYYWVKDSQPGDTTGDMVGGVWHTATE